MKVGLIGLGRMGEGMSRRMIKQGIEVHGYRNNYEKAVSNLKRVISVDVPLLWKAVQVVHTTEGVFTDTARVPGIFMMVVPAETVEDTLNELLQFCVEGDIIIDHGNSNFKDSRRRAERLLNLASNILTVALVVVFTVWSVDTVLWLVVQILQYKPALQSLGHSHQALDLPLVQTPVLTKHLPSMVGYIADQLEQVIL